MQSSRAEVVKRRIIQFDLIRVESSQIKRFKEQEDIIVVLSDSHKMRYNDITILSLKHSLVKNRC